MKDFKTLIADSSYNYKEIASQLAIKHVVDYMKQQGFKGVVQTQINYTEPHKNGYVFYIEVLNKVKNKETNFNIFISAENAVVYALQSLSNVSDQLRGNITSLGWGNSMG